MLLCDQKTFYIGISDDLKNRLTQHKNKLNISTKKFSDLRLVHAEKYPSKFETAKREQQLKGWSHAKKQKSEGAIITTALESSLPFTLDDDDGTFRNEIKHRIGIEGRTRLALKRANQRSKDSSAIVFFQGAFHLEGVKGWCLRNSIDLETVIPNAIKSKFRGKNSTLEFLE